MPLQKQILPINFNGGIDTKSDPKTVIPGKLLELQNGYWQKANRIQKRNGYDVLDNDVEGGDEITEGSALGVFNNELNLYTGNKLYTYLSANNKWIDKGTVNSTVLEQKQIVANTAVNQENPTVATNDGVTVYAMYQSGGVYYTVIDQLTGSQIVPRTLLALGVNDPHAVAFQDSILIFYSDLSGVLSYQKINTATPSQIDAAVVVTTDLNILNAPRYDAITIGDRCFFSYYDDTNTISTRYIDSSYAISGAVTQSQTAESCMGVFSDDSQNIWIACVDGGDEVAYFVLSYNLSVVVAPQAVETAPDVVKLITGAVIGTTATLYYEIDAASNQNDYIRTVDVVGASPGTPSNFIRSVGLAGKPFINNGIIFIPVVHESDLQSTYFIINQSGAATARISSGTGGELINNGMLSEVPLLSEDNYIFVSGKKGVLRSGNRFAIPYSPIGVSSTKITFNAENRFQNAQMGELYITGGFLQSYDGGANVVEDNFHLYPEYMTNSTETTGGAIEPGTYQYTAIYEWMDALGQIHRSAPCPPITQVVPAGTSTNKNTIGVDTLRITAKANVRVSLYRTEAAGEIFYFVNSLGNSTTTDSVAFQDIYADATIIDNEILYTTGGTLENIAPPSCSMVTTYRNRIFIAGLEDPLTFQYSKLRTPGTPVEFNDAFVMQIDPRGGEIKAIGALDNAVIFFKQNSIFAMSGDGPNDLGEQSDYQQPQLICSDVGCDNPNSVVLTADGLMFKSSKGICLLNRSLQVSYIGAEVEAYNDLLVTSSKLLAGKNQVRFTTDSDVCLVYDYFFGQWSVFTNHTAVDSDFWDDDFVFLKANGEVWIEDESFDDNGQAIVLSIVTAWMSLAGLQGFQRIYRMIILGEYKSPHKLQVDIGYDFSPYYSQNAIIDISDIYPETVYGEDSPYGEGTPYGGQYPLYQFKTHLTHQKCESVRFKFSDNQASIDGMYGEGFNITNMALEVGVKKGLNKMSVQNSFATTG